MKYLRKPNIDELAEKKYNHLLVGMIVLFLVGPLYMKTGLKFPLMGLHIIHRQDRVKAEKE